ncbi:DNA polymerase III subunit epsilon, partial [Burkholderia pseudomallei]
RLAPRVGRVVWRATGGEVGAVRAEAAGLASLAPSFNRRADRGATGDPQWPVGGPVALEERGDSRVFHVIDQWRYVG